MVFVDKTALLGFRPPMERERARSIGYLKKIISRKIKYLSVWNAACSVLAGIFLLDLVLEYSSRPLKENLLSFVFLLVFAAVLRLVRRHRKENQRLLTRIVRGEYLVMECRAHEVAFSAKLIGEAAVKIHNSHGQSCTEEFVLDSTTARECQANPGTKLLLAKCGDDFYVLLSDYRMGVDKV